VLALLSRAAALALLLPLVGLQIGLLQQYRLQLQPSEHQWLLSFVQLVERP